MSKRDSDSLVVNLAGPVVVSGLIIAASGGGFMPLLGMLFGLYLSSNALKEVDRHK
jgi:hypothetical protein